VVARDASQGLITAPRRVAVLRALALGDLLCAVPALRALRRAWPDAEIALIGLPWAREFVARFSNYLDRFIEFPGWPGLPEREPLLEQIPKFVAAMQREQFDLAIQLHGSGTIVNSLIALLGARQTAGFFPPGYFCPDAKTFALWPDDGLEVERLLSLVDFLGLETYGDELELPLDDADFDRLSQIANWRCWPDRFAIVHPGASVAERRWPAEKFAAVADRLADRGRQIVLTGVPSERAIAERVASHMQRAPLNLVGKTDLGSLGALVARADLLICNDTGISHVAAALQTPSVVISTGNNPARWAPKNQRLHRVLCRAGGVTLDEVCREAIDLLRAPTPAVVKCQAAALAVI
jgi:ADP-heptose:LPS heptosyltransferase